MKPDFDLIGVGVGPFHLSLAALMDPIKELSSKFFDQKKNFSWHSEIMFSDSVMQTSYLKDLVTPVDPTNPHSFLNFLVKKGLFYAHMNTNRAQVTRREFELYCQWVSENLGSQLSFNCPVNDIEFKNNLFHVHAGEESYTATNLSIATGPRPWTPDFAHPFISKTCFHAKSPELAQSNLTGKKVVIIGGGQTGLEVFRNAFKCRWGKPLSTTLISRRHTLEPLDESPFTNEYFSPSYVNQFYSINACTKAGIVEHQRLASDGNTPFYLQELYNELYQLKHIEQDPSVISILPQRKLESMEKVGESYQLSVMNQFEDTLEKFEADIVIFCTGLRNQPPKCLDSIKHHLNLDKQERFIINKTFDLDWKFSETNKIYALNFGRHIHGIAEPQTSLMAWRSGTIINDLTGKLIYPGVEAVHNFTQHGVKL